MSELILHHYALSPFSEKIRLMLGYTGLAWQSAISPAMPPRPIVDPLAGGYRKIPVAQIGADIFCDTRIISSEIAKLADRPLLTVENCSIEIQEFVQFVDRTAFMATVVSGSPKKAMLLLLTHFTPWSAYRFIKDRAGIQKTSKSKRITAADGLDIMRDFIKELDEKLAGQAFLFADEPCSADFSTYHVLWFRDKTRGNKDLRKLANLSRWWDAMSKFGHGQQVKVKKNAVFKQALAEQPRQLPGNGDAHPLMGKSVQIQPDDYAQTPTQGTLVFAGKDRWIVARETEDFGTLHVHFPLLGYEISAVK